MADGSVSVGTYDDGRDFIRMTYSDLADGWVYHVEGEVIDGRAALVSLSVVPRDRQSPAPLRRDVLRKVPLAVLVDRVKSTLQVKCWPGRVEEATAGVRKPGKEGRKWPNGHFRQVAWYYNHAKIIGMPPRQAVASEWGVHEVTASRWLAKARKLGYLDEYDASAPRSPRPGDDEAHAQPAIAAMRSYPEASDAVDMSIFRKVLCDLLEDAHSDTGVSQSVDPLIRSLVSALFGPSDGAVSVRHSLFMQRLRELVKDGDEEIRLAARLLASRLIDTSSTQPRASGDGAGHDDRSG